MPKANVFNMAGQQVGEIEVSGGGIKPYRQKGTGRARQGSTRAP